MPNKSLHNIDKFSTENVLRSKEKVLEIKEPLVMGIINLSPDSFYAGNRNIVRDDLLRMAEKHINEGASILDIGAISSRPGALIIGEAQEKKRLFPALKWIRSIFPEIWLSVDTWRANIAEQCLTEGADMINDISGGSFDENMPKVIGKNNIPYVLMHMKGQPLNMQQNPMYIDVVMEIFDFFKTQCSIFSREGATQMILDPGFGFGKTLKHNYTILKHLDIFHDLGYPLLAGISRKSMIYKVLTIDPQDALNGTTVLNALILLKGVKIIRVHDVKEAIETIKITQMYLSS